MSENSSAKTLAGGGENGSKKMKCELKTVRGAVVLGKAPLADLATGVHVPLVDWFHELLGHRVSLQLISAGTADPGE